MSSWFTWGRRERSNARSAGLPVRLKRAAGLAVGLTSLAGLAGLAGCGHGTEGFDSEAYCQAIADGANRIDSAALVEGDEDALVAALGVYQDLQALAPPALTAPWAEIVRNLDSMLQAARGDLPTEEVDYVGFSEAYQAVEKDKKARCE
jgi:hypothetical protein